MSKSVVLIAAVILAAGISDNPATAFERPEACATEAARQFDFWPGTWHVESRYRTGPDSWLETQGEWRAESVVGGCVFIDFANGEFAGSPMRGMGTRYFDPRAGEWLVSWISTAQPGVWQEWRGGFQDGVGDFYSTPPAEAGDVYSRLQWRDITDDSAEWTFAVTRDGGKSWTTHWAMSFERTDR